VPRNISKVHVGRQTNLRQSQGLRSPIFSLAEKPAEAATPASAGVTAAD
jgi:hypothetical protein